MTRISKFLSSFEEFMIQFNLDKYDFTKNNERNTGSLHMFTLHMPIHYNERVPEYVDGEVHYVETPKTQERPTIEAFEEKFATYFDPHSTVSWNRVSIVQREIDENQVLIINIRLRLGNGMNLPFPTPNNDDARFQRQEQTIRHLRERMRNFDQVCYRIRVEFYDRLARESELRHRIRRKCEKEKKRLMDKNKSDVTRIINRLKEYYTKDDKRSECPVCYEEIEADKLYVPGCCHYLCDTCANHVIQLNNKCPICRDPLYTTDGEYVPPQQPLDLDPMARHMGQHDRIPDDEMQEILRIIDVQEN